MPCNPNDLNINIPSPAGIGIPGFGIPGIPGLNPSLFPEGFPEDIMDIFDKLSMLLPSGILKPNLNIKFHKDIFDGILNILNKFFPFLLMYKFFLPLLNLIICIIEVLCAFPRPFKMRKAIKKLFRSCLPDFLRLFPIFALIAMIISLLYLIIQLIEYIINYIKKMIEQIKKNIQLLKTAFTNGNAQSILAATRKLSDLLCLFQQLFIIFAIFNIIFSVFKDILNMSFKIPPCKTGSGSDASECCTPDVCPEFILNGNYTRTTGRLRFISEVTIETPPPFGGLITNYQRQSSFSFFDFDQEQAQAFSNIYNAFDVTTSPKPLFFPTDKTFSSTSDIRQVPYLVDIELEYDPAKFGRINSLSHNYGAKRRVIFKNCVVIKAPTSSLPAANSFATVDTGVLTLAGGQGFEIDGTTKLMGINSAQDFTSTQATLETFLYTGPVVSTTQVNLSLPAYQPMDFLDVTYTFKINEDYLTEQNLVILGCDKEFDMERDILFTGLFDNLGPKLDLVNSIELPDMAGALNYLQVSVATLRDNFTEEAVDNFQNNTIGYLTDLSDKTKKSILELIDAAFDQNSSTFTIDPEIQFTTDAIKVEVTLKDSNGVNIMNGIDDSTAALVAKKLEAIVTLGQVSAFTFTSNSTFIADLTSKDAGNGTIQMKYNNIYFIDFVIPDDPDVLPSSSIKTLNYSFIKSSFIDNTKVRREDTDLGK